MPAFAEIARREERLPSSVEDWQARGRTGGVLGHLIHVFERAGPGPVLVFLHGFPTSSYDWRQVIELLPGRAVLAFDFLGFGLSEKPRDFDYSLFSQADLAQAVITRYSSDRDVCLVAHDMGTGVAMELIARELTGNRRARISRAILLNGAILVDLAHASSTERVLRSPLGPILARVSNEKLFRRRFSSLFSPTRPLEEEEAVAQWALISREQGHRISHLLYSYMGDRSRHAVRLEAALRGWPKPIDLVWGMRDPVTGPVVLQGLRQVLPKASVDELPDVGHYPQIEAPVAVAAAIECALTTDIEKGA